MSKYIPYFVEKEEKGGRMHRVHKREEEWWLASVALSSSMVNATLVHLSGLTAYNEDANDTT
jgi:hypothetical protein